MWDSPRASHSLGWFLQQISDTDERQICPNVVDPAGWYRCDSLHTCRLARTATYARAARKVLRLRCLDRSPHLRSLCQKDEPLFLKNVSEFGGGLSIACFLRAPGGHNSDAAAANCDVDNNCEGEGDEERRPITRRLQMASEFCTPPVAISIYLEPSRRPRRILIRL